MDKQIEITILKTKIQQLEQQIQLQKQQIQTLQYQLSKKQKPRDLMLNHLFK